MQQPLPFSPKADLPLTWDFRPWKGAASITSYSITVPTGLTMAQSQNNGGLITAWVNFGASPPRSGSVVSLLCDVVTDDSPRPRKDTRKIDLLVVQR